jgi:hypothetical protein
MKMDEFSHQLLGTGGKIVLSHLWAVLWLFGVRGSSPDVRVSRNSGLPTAPHHFAGNG